MDDSKASKAAQALSALGASKGGEARAKKLTPEQREDIARHAALARWPDGPKGPPRATHEGTLTVGEANIPCAVLQDGTRVLTQWGFLRAIGRSGRPAAGRGSDVEKVAPFLALDNLSPYVSAELADSTRPVVFRVARGGTAYGYKAELLPKVCEVYLKARDDGVLLKPQEKFAKACEMLMRGLAHVGITALVDEATGYQEVRDRLALQAILDRYLREEFAAWAKRFPDEFYRHIFRLRGWAWKGMKVNRPQVVANYTKDIVYARLAPGILKELEARNPKDERGYRRAAHHQWLTEDVGHPALAQHLYAVVGLMRISEHWDEFKKLLDRAYPRRGDTLQLDLFAGSRA
jgi:P63C domain